MTTAEKPKLAASTLREVHHAEHWRHLWRSVMFALLYAGGAWGAWMLAGVAARNPWAWVPAAPCYVIAAASLHGISLFTH